MNASGPSIDISLYPPERALDGKNDTNNFWHPPNEYFSWLQVDMGKSQTIVRVEMYHR